MSSFWDGIVGLLKHPIDEVKWITKEGVEGVGKNLIKGDFDEAWDSFKGSFGSHNDMMAENITKPLFGSNKLSENPDAVAGTIIGSIFAAPLLASGSAAASGSGAAGGGGAAGMSGGGISGLGWQGGANLTLGSQTYAPTTAFGSSAVSSTPTVTSSVGAMGLPTTYTPTTSFGSMNLAELGSGQGSSLADYMQQANKINQQMQQEEQRKKEEQMKQLQQMMSSGGRLAGKYNPNMFGKF